MITNQFKDFFSGFSEVYSQYRPLYPGDLFQYLQQQVGANVQVWDCATGSGQAALGLTNCFDKIIATDASPEQIASANKAFSNKVYNRVNFQVSMAESTNLEDYSIGLITVAEAIHWFDLPKFYLEVNRVLETGGLMALWSYGNCHITPEIDSILDDYRYKTLADYWPKEACMADVDNYPLPSGFEEVSTPEFTMSVDWNIEQFFGYLNSWSATGLYYQENKTDPLIGLKQDIMSLWGGEDYTRTLIWPMQFRLGQKVV